MTSSFGRAVVRQTWLPTFQCTANNSCGLSRPRLSAEQGSVLTLCALLPREHSDRGRARHYWTIAVIQRGTVHANYLTRFRRHQTHAPCHYVDAFWIAQAGIFQPQGAVHLRQIAE